MNIEWDKIVTNAVSALVVTVFLGAATVVWKGATTVDDKVQNTRDDMTHLIDTLSDKLAGYEVQLSSLSNQLTVVISNQSNLVVTTQFPQFPLTGMGTPPKAVKETLVIPQKPAASEVDGTSRVIQRKAYSQDINRELKRVSKE